MGDLVEKLREYGAIDRTQLIVPHWVLTQAADEIARLREALEKARAQFQFYTEEHKAKSDTAFKAWDDARYWGNVDEQGVAHKEYHKRLTQTQTNRQFVEMIDAALQRKEPQP